MSIDDAILYDCLSKGTLVEVPLLDIELTETRRILATPKLMQQIDESTGTDPRFTAELRADLDKFIGGAPVTVGGPKHRKADMKPLMRANDKKPFGTHEVWEIRSIDDEPQIRVFGRFAQKNVFVATDWELRSNLFGFESLSWRREIRRCKHDWTGILGAREPHTGITVHDYISDPVADLRTT